MSRYSRSNSSRPFYRVKNLNGVSSNEIDHWQMFNVLNCSPMDKIDLVQRVLMNGGSIGKENTNEAKPKSTITTVQIFIELQKKLIDLKGLCIDPSGHLVNYRQLRCHSIYNDLCELTKHLANINLDTVTENERKTFFINLYNALTIHGIAKLNEYPKSVLDLNQFWKTTSYQVGPSLYSLDDIQHGILRGNKPHSNCTQRHFTFNDPRTKYSMRRCDPRIHFVLNSGARSSPQITIYSSSHLEKALNMATTLFCNTEIEIDMENNEVFLPKLFLWYRNDFGRSDCDVLRWITKFIDEPKRSLLQALLDQQVSKDGLHLSYKIFDWMLNDYS